MSLTTTLTPGSTPEQIVNDCLVNFGYFVVKSNESQSIGTIVPYIGNTHGIDLNHPTVIIDHATKEDYIKQCLYLLHLPTLDTEFYYKVAAE